MLDSNQNLATFLSFFYVKFWLCPTNATDALQLVLVFLKLMEETKTKLKDPGTIKMVEAAYVKLKDHLWYLSERLVPPALFSASSIYCSKCCTFAGAGAGLPVRGCGVYLNAGFV